MRGDSYQDCMKKAALRLLFLRQAVFFFPLKKRMNSISREK